MIKLAGILVVAVGFALRFNTLLVVMAAGIVTGLAAGMSFHGIMGLFGKYFVENRYMTLPIVLMVPLIGLLERHGLQERAETLIRRAQSATAGRVILLYTAVRQITVALGINLGSSGGAHASFVRPLVAPMAEGAARARHGDLPDRTAQLILANAAAAENTGNFFGEDVFIGQGSWIDEGSIIEPRVVIGKNVHVGPETHVGRAAQLESNAKIGRNVRIASQARVAADMTVPDDTVIAPRSGRLAEMAAVESGQAEAAQAEAA